MSGAHVLACGVVYLPRGALSSAHLNRAKSTCPHFHSGQYWLGAVAPKHSPQPETAWRTLGAQARTLLRVAKNIIALKKKLGALP